MRLLRIEFILLPIILILVLVACDVEEPQPTQVPNTPTLPTPTATITPLPPTQTPIPLAARVNGEGISMEEFQAELERFVAAQELDSIDLGEKVDIFVLSDLIDRYLLAQAAWQAGFTLGEEELQVRMAALVDEIGGEEVFSSWLVAHGYSEDSFEEALRLSIASAWMRDQILASVPETAEQIRARQIFTSTAEQANRILNQLQAGEDFEALAVEYDPLLWGDLGWFPRGYLLENELEKVAFEMQAGEHSQVIQTRLGFHILQVVERDPDRELEPDAYLTLQMQALKDWLGSRREESDIQILLPVSD
jgi:peptidyl-prolyl cis-trans isomerase C